MNRRFLLLAVTLVPLLVTGCASTGGEIDNTRIGKLASSLGLTTEQAQAGAGVVLSRAQQALDPATYGRIAAVVPRANEYMAQASRSGAFVGSVGDVAELNAAFSKLGFSQSQVDRFVPTLTDYVSGAAGPDVGMSLANTLR